MTRLETYEVNTPKNRYRHRARSSARVAPQVLGDRGAGARRTWRRQTSLQRHCRKRCFVQDPPAQARAQVSPRAPGSGASRGPSIPASLTTSSGRSSTSASGISRAAAIPAVQIIERAMPAKSGCRRGAARPTVRPCPRLRCRPCLGEPDGIPAPDPCSPAVGPRRPPDPRSTVNPSSSLIPACCENCLALLTPSLMRLKLMKEFPARLARETGRFRHHMHTVRCDGRNRSR